MSWADKEEKLSSSNEQHDGATGGRKVTLAEALDMTCTVIPTEQSQLRMKEVPKKIRKSTDGMKLIHSLLTPLWTGALHPRVAKNYVH